MRPRVVRAHMPPRVLRYAIVVTLFVSIMIWLRTPQYYDPYYHDYTRPKTMPRTRHPPVPLESKPAPRGSHPVDQLVRDAQHTFEEWMRTETRTLEDAATAYRRRRGRHPPPGFRLWWEFATERNAVVVEDFWDQIYDDLGPFWALTPAYIRREAADYDMAITVRNGTASSPSGWFWTVIWLDMLKSIEHLLPDMDVPVNSMDEPRIVAPWEDIKAYMESERKGRNRMPRPDRVVQNFQPLVQPSEVEADRDVADKDWETKAPYWPIAARGCPPDSAARRATVRTEFDGPPAFRPELVAPHSRAGFVANATLASHICHQPDLQGLQGYFIRPLTTSATRTLFPLFGGSKLSVNNEILLPPAMYWSEEERFTGGSNHGGRWDDKVGGVIWRGVATGGRNAPDNWRGFQRHRFVSMNNATEVFYAEQGVREPENFVLPGTGGGPQQVTLAQRDGRLANWLGGLADVAFTDLMCLADTECAYSAPHYEVLDGVSMEQQFNYKYLPDVDGNSFSGRYIGFLRSTSLPIKATLFREWSSSRLLAWKHFVPMDARFGDWYAIMEYFLGYDSRKVRDPHGRLEGEEGKRRFAEAHDEVGERIATDGKTWAEMVLRREDMQIYTLRLLLEYARVADDRREYMGWVEDLL